MSNLPRFLLRNCMLWAARQSMLGQIGDITPPIPTAKLEELRNAGMIKPREIHLGYEKLDFSFKMPGLHPEVIKLFGLKPGAENPFMITGALVDESGEDHSAVMSLRAFLNKADPGNWKPGEMAENDYAASVNYYKLEIGGRVLIEMDDFDISVDGVSQYSGIRNSLLL